MNEPRDKFPVIYVEWEDSESNYGCREPLDGDIAPIRSVGVLVQRDKRTLTISTSKTEYGKYVDQLSIPMCSVKKIKKVKI